MKAKDPRSESRSPAARHDGGVPEGKDVGDDLPVERGPVNHEHEHEDEDEDDIDLYPASVLAVAMKIDPVHLLHQARDAAQPLLFRARFIHDPDPRHRPTDARTWRRWSDPDEDDEIGAEPIVEAVLPLPLKVYSDLIGGPNRKVSIGALTVKDGDDNKVVELLPNHAAIGFADLLVDDEAWDFFVGKPKRTRGGETKTRQSDLQVLLCFVHLAVRANPERFGSLDRPKLSALAAELVREAGLAGLPGLRSPNTVTTRLEEARKLVSSHKGQDTTATSTDTRSGS